MLTVLPTAVAQRVAHAKRTLGLSLSGQAQFGSLIPNLWPTMRRSRSISPPRHRYSVAKGCYEQVLMRVDRQVSATVIESDVIA